MMQPLEEYTAYPVPTKRIWRDPDFNCRSEFTQESVKDLADAIAQVGKLMEPIWIQPAADVPGGVPRGYEWRAIAGHRRLLAVTTFLKWTTIPARIIPGLTPHDAYVLNLMENMERKDLTPLEEAIAIQRIYPNGVTLRQASEELKRDTRWVHKRLRLLQVPHEVQQLVHARRLTLLDLEEIVCKRETPEDQIRAANALANGHKGRGKKRTVRLAGEKLERSFRRRRNKSEINALVTCMLNLGLSGLPLRIAAWCAGHISDDEINADIRSAIGK